MPQRRLVVLRGTVVATAERAAWLVAGLVPVVPVVAGGLDDVLWVGGDAPRVDAGIRQVPAREVAGLLGGAFDAVVLSLHGGLDADLIGQCQGFVRAGGALVLRLPEGAWPLAARAPLAAYPFGPEAVGTRFERHFMRVLAAHEPETTAPEPLAPATRTFAGTAEQAAVVAQIAGLWREAPRAIALTADRGRGKSSALGLAIARLAADGGAARRVVVTAGQPEAVAEVLAFAAGTATFEPLAALLGGLVQAPDALVVDEAAQLPVPVLQRLVARYPAAHLAFATTVRGYEGTGRGFALRFLAWLARQARPVTRLELVTPIRWCTNDRLERWMFEALLLDADLAEVVPLEADESAGELAFETLDRDRLVDAPGDLADLFGLLVHAHYRTTPGDLQRLLDAPNLALHVVRYRSRIVGACMAAREGGLDSGTTDAVATGRVRIRAHALADALVAHLGHAEAGPMPMVRSVRIAVHPALRRLGLARQLVGYVHAAYGDGGQAAPALFGTLFGATPELIRFRREVGYEVVRVSASRGARTGEPSVLMLAPVSAAARALVAALRAELARELPRQLALFEADGELVLDPALTEALMADLPPPTPLAPAARDGLAAAYAAGPRTFESLAFALRAFALAHPAALAALPPPLQALVSARVVLGAPWAKAAAASRQPSVPAAMRALRRAIAQMVQAVRAAGD